MRHLLAILRKWILFYGVVSNGSIALTYCVTYPLPCSDVSVVKALVCRTEGLLLLFQIQNRLAKAHDLATEQTDVTKKVRVLEERCHGPLKQRHPAEAKSRRARRNNGGDRMELWRILLLDFKSSAIIVCLL